jgi:lysophospholipase L1-like esterase
MSRLVLALIAVLLLPILAASAEPPYTHPPDARLEIVPSGPSYIGVPQESYQLFVFGDSLAAGLFSGMSRMAEGDLRLAIDGRFKDDSGLTRPEFYDWAAALPKIHDRREIDIAVILLGSNDGQDIRSISGPIQFGTPEWASTYAQRVDDMIRILKQRGIAIYWVELPPMGPAPLEAEAGFVATVQRDRVEREKIRYIETRKIFSDATGRYTDQGTDVNGKAMRLRARDGIHFLKSGNSKLGLMVLQAIRRDIAAADGKVAKLTSPHSDFPSSPEPQRTVHPLPVFGQMSGSKEETALTLVAADPQWASAVLAVSGGAQKENALNTPQTVVNALKARVPPQSTAGILLNAGQWPEAKDGRHDDFRWPRQK